MIRRFIFLLFFLFFFLPLFSQQYYFKKFGKKEGLPSINIKSLFQDVDGFIWVGMQQGGIARFDGKSFKLFTKDEGLVSNEITCITQDKDKQLWIASNQGVSCFDGRTFKNYTTKEGLRSNNVQQIFIDDKNKIWLATDNGINVFDGKEFKSITKQEGLKSENVFTITQDKKGNMWFGLSQSGIVKYENDKLINYSGTEIYNKRSFFSSFTDSEGNIWFGGTDEQGILKYNGKKFEQIKEFENLALDQIGHITEDKQNNIWFATAHGAVKYNPKNKTYQQFEQNNGLSSNSVQTFCVDYEGNIWIGTFAGGVDLFKNQAIINYTSNQGLPTNNINTLHITRNKKVLAAPFSLGLYALNGKIAEPINTSNDITSENILAIADNANNELWVGTEKNGIFVYTITDNKFILKKHITTLKKSQLTATMKILFDSSGNTWIGTFGAGLFRIDKKGEEFHYAIDSGFPTENIVTLYEDKKHEIWAGTYDNGLVSCTRKGFPSYNETNGLLSNSVWAITADDDNNLYLGTEEYGLLRYDGKDFKNLTKSNGLCSNFIESIVWDTQEKCLWAGTNKGINRIVVNKDFSISAIRFFGEEEGFNGMEVNNNAIEIDNNGTVWFAAINGLSCFNPIYDYQNSTAPKIKLTKIRLAYQDIDWRKMADSVDATYNLPFDLKLNHNNNHLTFEFQALTTSNIAYSYKLEGAESEWSPPSTTNIANYSNITPGQTYTFMVKAKSSNGIESEIESFSFTIFPPWWQTWWFYTLVILVSLTSIYSIIKYRTAALAKEKKILEEKVEERTIDLLEANQKLGLAFQEITDSINYARIIQDAILPIDEEIKKELRDSFVIYKPRNVVSGDFYWFTKRQDKIYFAAVDCTGHGVPGAFMSMIGSSLLNEIISTEEEKNAGEILDRLQVAVRKALKQDRESIQSKDGMDLALVSIDYAQNKIEYAGAKRPLYMVEKNGELQELKADKQSIGGMQIEEQFKFTNHQIALNKGTRVYLFTDGFVDQFGGANQKKYSTKRLKEQIITIQDKNIKEQGFILQQSITSWMGKEEQVDDILLIGIEV
jgi:ligand-binding sensor domain-containing protein/serine phosphatase RsbU (regulator of sigma subunit)